MRTLADLTSEERAQCRGMWCEDIHGDLYVYLGAPTLSIAHDEETGAPMGTFINTQEPETIEAPLAAFAPRFDLPRAWAADGQPPAGEWEHTHIPGLGESTRRFVGEWEEA